MRMTKTAAIVAGVALTLPVAAVSTSANAGTSPPPCTNKEIAKTLTKADPAGGSFKVLSKYCEGKWASGGMLYEGEFERAYLLEAKGSKWKVVEATREEKLCMPSNKTLPKKIKKHACVS